MSSSGQDGTIDAASAAKTHPHAPQAAALPVAVSPTPQTAAAQHQTTASTAQQPVSLAVAALASPPQTQPPQAALGEIRIIIDDPAFRPVQPHFGANRVANSTNIAYRGVRSHAAAVDRLIFANDLTPVRIDSAALILGGEGSISPEPDTDVTSTTHVTSNGSDRSASSLAAGGGVGNAGGGRPFSLFFDPTQFSAHQHHHHHHPHKHHHHIQATQQPGTIHGRTFSQNQRVLPASNVVLQPHATRLDHPRLSRSQSPRTNAAGDIIDTAQLQTAVVAVTTARSQDDLLNVQGATSILGEGSVSGFESAPLSDASSVRSAHSEAVQHISTTMATGVLSSAASFDARRQSKSTCEPILADNAARAARHVLRNPNKRGERQLIKAKRPQLIPFRLFGSSTNLQSSASSIGSVGDRRNTSPLVYPPGSSSPMRLPRLAHSPARSTRSSKSETGVSLPEMDRANSASAALSQAGSASSLADGSQESFSGLISSPPLSTDIKSNTTIDGTPTYDSEKRFAPSQGATHISINQLRVGTVRPRAGSSSAGSGYGSDEPRTPIDGRIGMNSNAPFYEGITTPKSDIGLIMKPTAMQKECSSSTVGSVSKHSITGPYLLPAGVLSPAQLPAAGGYRQVLVQKTVGDKVSTHVAGFYASGAAPNYVYPTSGSVAGSDVGFASGIVRPSSDAVSSSRAVYTGGEIQSDGEGNDSQSGLHASVITSIGGEAIEDHTQDGIVPQTVSISDMGEHKEFYLMSSEHSGVPAVAVATGGSPLHQFESIHLSPDMQHISIPAGGLPAGITMMDPMMMDVTGEGGLMMPMRPKDAPLQFAYTYRQHLADEFLSSIALHGAESVAPTSHYDEISISSPTQQYIPLKIASDIKAASTVPAAAQMGGGFSNSNASLVRMASSGGALGGVTINMTAPKLPVVIPLNADFPFDDPEKMIAANERITFTSFNGSLLAVVSVLKSSGGQEKAVGHATLARHGKNKLAFENFKILERRKATSYAEFLHPVGVLDSNTLPSYDPRELDYDTVGDNARTVIALPSYLGTVMKHTSQRDADRLIETRFQRKAHSSLNIRMLHQLRRDMVSIGIGCGMELSSVATAIVLVEKLVLKSKLTRQTRKHHAVGCLSLAVKVNEMHPPTTLSEQCDKFLGVPASEFKAAEWRTYVDVEFTAYVPRSELQPHLTKLQREFGDSFKQADPRTDDLGVQYIGKSAGTLPVDSRSAASTGYGQEGRRRSSLKGKQPALTEMNGSQQLTSSTNESQNGSANGLSVKPTPPDSAAVFQHGRRHIAEMSA